MPRRRRTRAQASRQRLLEASLPTLDRAAIAAMEQFLRREYNARRIPTTTAATLVLIVALTRDPAYAHEPFPIRARVVDHLGLDSPFGIDCAIRKSLERGLIFEQVDILTRDNPDRPQDKHQLARRKYIPADILCDIVDDALARPYQPAHAPRPKVARRHNNLVAA